MPGIVFVSIDDFSREGFTNGLFLQVRELLRHFSARGHATSLTCITPQEHPGSERRTRQIQGCTVHETFVAPAEGTGAYRHALGELLTELDPDVILLNSCAVRLTAAHHAVLDESLASGRHVDVLVTDQLYPTHQSHPADEIQRYYDLMHRARVHTVSQTIADDLYSQTGVPARVLPNLIPVRPVGPPTCQEAERRYLTLINHHPIKGRQVWDALIRYRPHDIYLTVQTWPDVPPYAPLSPNVRVAEFSLDPTTIYNQTRILLIPSLGPEGVPRVALEAMELGVPVIAHRIGSLPELGNAVSYVSPPPITGYELDEDNILYPLTSPEEVTRAARAFDQAIEAIDHDATVRNQCAADGQAFMREYRERCEAAVDRLLDSWFSTV